MPLWRQLAWGLLHVSFGSFLGIQLQLDMQECNLRRVMKLCGKVKLGRRAILPHQRRFQALLLSLTEVIRVGCNGSTPYAYTDAESLVSHHSRDSSSMQMLLIFFALFGSITVAVQTLTLPMARGLPLLRSQGTSKQVFANVT